MALDAVRSLRPGKNLLAVQCRNTEGSQFVDVGLLGRRRDPDRPPSAFSLLGLTTPEEASGRSWSDAYLALTAAYTSGVHTARGRPCGPTRKAPILWAHARSAPPMLPPRSTGAIRSPLLPFLEEGTGT